MSDLDPDLFVFSSPFGVYLKMVSAHKMAGLTTERERLLGRLHRLCSFRKLEINLRHALSCSSVLKIDFPLDTWFRLTVDLSEFSRK